MHLTETEFDIVQKMPKGNGTFLLRQGSRSVVVQAPLGGLDVEIAVISGTRRGADALKLARQRTDDATGPVLVAAYQNALLELAQ
jgi:type IV secretory pathway VirB4 component